MLTNRCRVAASAIAPLSYICLVSGMVAGGAALNLIGQILIFPFALKHRAWDMVALTIFFTGVNAVALAPHLAKLVEPPEAKGLHYQQEGVRLTTHSTPRTQ